MADPVALEAHEEYSRWSVKMPTRIRSPGSSPGVEKWTESGAGAIL
jgi:hypothetical protein